MKLKDKRYLLRQLKCALGEAPCDPVGRRLKSKLTFVCYLHIFSLRNISMLYRCLLLQSLIFIFVFNLGLTPLVLMGSCPQCSANEVRQIQKVLAHIQKNYPAEWSKVIQQYSG